MIEKRPIDNEDHVVYRLDNEGERLFRRAEHELDRMEDIYNSLYVKYPLEEFEEIIDHVKEIQHLLDEVMINKLSTR